MQIFPFKKKLTFQDYSSRRSCVVVNARPRRLHPLGSVLWHLELFSLPIDRQSVVGVMIKVSRDPSFPSHLFIFWKVV